MRRPGVYGATISMKKLAILGSTGSIGTQVLDIVRKFPREFKVIGMTAHANTPLFKTSCGV